MSRLALLAALLLLGAPAALAQTQPRLAGVGRISVQGGWRVSPNGQLYDRFYGVNPDAPRPARSAGGPLVLGTFAYAVTDLVEVGIDLFVGGERLRLGSRPEVRSTTYGALLGVRFQSLLAGVGPAGFVPSIGLLTGPALVHARTEGEAPSEIVTQAWAGSVGGTLRVTPRWGVTLEYRLVFAQGLLPGCFVCANPAQPPAQDLDAFNGGGHWFGLGVTYSFPPRPDRPRGLGGRLAP